jgi:hypothetical protein
MDTISFAFGFVTGSLVSIGAMLTWAIRAVRPYMNAQKQTKKDADGDGQAEPPASFIFIPDSVLRQARRPPPDLRPPDKWPPDLDDEE